MRHTFSYLFLLRLMFGGSALQSVLRKVDNLHGGTCSEKEAARLSRYVGAGAIFVHIPKTGGTTIEHALLGVVPCSEGKTKYGDCGSNHATGNDFLSCNSTLYQSTTSFAVLREPLSRARSSYQYAVDGGNGSPNDHRKYGWVSEVARKHGYWGGFEVFLEKLAQEGRRALDPVGQRQVDFVLRSSGGEHDADVDVNRLVVDRLLCLESLDEDWANLQQIILALQSVQLPPPTRTSNYDAELNEPSPRVLELMRDPFYAADVRLWQKYCNASG